MGIRDLISSLKKQFQDIKTDLPANMAYVQNKVAQKIMPSYPLPSSESFGKMASPEEIKRSRLIASLSNGPVKSMSAQLNQYPVAPNTPTSNFVNEQKQRVIASSGIRPAMQRYLSTIPIHTTQPNQQFAGMYNPNNETTPPNTPWELSRGPGIPTITSSMSSTANLEKMKNNPYSDSVMLHELTHASMPIRNKETNNNFEDFFKTVNPESSPLLYQTGLTYYNNGEPAPNSEEFYATIAQRLGPSVLDIPEIRKFYENFFEKDSKVDSNIYNLYGNGGRNAQGGNIFSEVTNQKVNR